MRPSKQKGNVTPPVVVSSDVARRIRQHARSHMKTEVCGVLIGGINDGALHIEECIAGKDAAQAGTHVTFTQDTWEHIYKVKDAAFPNDRIVGWYHSHPGFGIFLSDHDTFIHRNFFSAPEQVAWVYDPHSDEEGFFGWAGERVERLGVVSFSDPRGGEECTENHGAMESVVQHDDEDMDQIIVKSRYTEQEESPAVRWVGAILTHLLALGLGVLIAWYIFPRVIVVPVDPRTGSPLIGLPQDTTSSSPSQAPAASSPSTTSSPDASQKQDPQKKGDNAQPK
jgi:proteasome lid subunit RPN8/RPN11